MPDLILFFHSFIRTHPWLDQEEPHAGPRHGEVVYCWKDTWRSIRMNRISSQILGSVSSQISGLLEKRISVFVQISGVRSNIFSRIFSIMPNANTIYPVHPYSLVEIMLNWYIVYQDFSYWISSLTIKRYPLLSVQEEVTHYLQ